MNGPRSRIHGATVWLGREVGGRGEADAVFEVREKEVQFERVSADETTGVFGVGEIKTIRSRVRWCGCLIGPMDGQRR
jgi:hypothetical protein